MSRYFLHLKRLDQSVVEDPEGLDLPSLQAAQEEALQGIRDVVAADIKGGHEVTLEAIIIADNQGRQLATVPLRAALPKGLLQSLLEELVMRRSAFMEHSV
jgi:hypothetical protein